jgi:hypothetical protein
MEVPGRTASWAAILTLVLLTGGAAACSIATARGELSGAPPLSPTYGASRPPARQPIVLRGDGFGSAVFNSPRSAAPTPSNDCTVDAYLQWPMMTAYFDHQRFVGFTTGSLGARPGYREMPNMVTPAGLKIGDTLAQARRIYGADFRTSLAQGGSWFVATSTGTLDGLSN